MNINKETILIYTAKCPKCNWKLTNALGTTHWHCCGCNTTYDVTVKEVKRSGGIV